MTKRYRAASKKKNVIEESLGLTGLAAALRRATLSDRVVGGATSTGWSFFVLDPELVRQGIR